MRIVLCIAQIPLRIYWRYVRKAAMIGKTLLSVEGPPGVVQGIIVRNVEVGAAGLGLKPEKIFCPGIAIP